MTFIGYYHPYTCSVLPCFTIGAKRCDDGDGHEVIFDIGWLWWGGMLYFGGEFPFGE